MQWMNDEDVAAISDITRQIRAAGGALYLVGGRVRDALLGRIGGDHDFCVTGLTAQDFVSALPGVLMTGKAFPVFRVSVGTHFAEFALARTEVKQGSGHTGFVVYSSPDVGIVEDLRRRDVTVNAMAVALDTGELIDPFEGAADVRAGILRAVSDAFAEDPLRVYRVARLAAQLRFAVAAPTLDLMSTLREELYLLSAERVGQELHKALLTSHPSLFVETLRQAGVLDVHFPELQGLVGVLQSLVHHPEGDAYAHTLQVVDVAAQRGRTAAVRYAALLHDVGKGLTPREEWPSHHGHEARGAALARALSQRLKVPTQWRRGAVFATENHMLLHGWQNMRPATIVDLYARARRSALGVAGFAAVCEADACGRNRMEAICEDTDAWLALCARMEVEVNGDVLAGKLGPRRDQATGKAFGEALRHARIAYVCRYLRALRPASSTPACTR